MLRMGIQAWRRSPAPASGTGPQGVPVPAAQAGIRPNQVWALDTTYIPMARGFVYLTAVVDVASRRVLAHKVAITLEACHAERSSSRPLAKYGTPEIVNTDQGSQFTAEEFTASCSSPGLPAVSMDGRGAWRDNVFVERLWRSVKYERVYKYAYASVSDAGPFH
jgi:putative transposase